MENLKLGSFVKSVKGRDENNIYIVKEISKDRVVLVDGAGKMLAKPKTKNIKHIEVLGFEPSKIGEKFATGQKVFDAEVYSAIRKIKIM